MHTPLTTLLRCLTTLLLGFGSVAWAENESLLGIKPESNFQQQFNEIFKGITGNDKRGQRSLEVSCQSWAELSKLLDKEGPEGIRQMIWWSSTAEVGPMGLLPLSAIKICDVESRTIAEGIAPVFDHLYVGQETPRDRSVRLSVDKNVRSACDMTLMIARVIERPIEANGYTVYDFSSYDRVVSRILQDEKVGKGLVRHLYSLSPGQALLTIAKHECSRKELRRLAEDERIISDFFWWSKQKNTAVRKARAINRLSDLSAYKQWWVRLYVVEILNRSPELAKPEQIRQLNKDPNTVVREAVNPEVFREYLSDSIESVDDSLSKNLER